jgi:hypothetical protein
MPTGQIALVREQNVEFAVVCVRDSVINNHHERERNWHYWKYKLQRPIALLGAQQHQVYGDKNIIDFVSSIDPTRLPWRNFNI